MKEAKGVIEDHLAPPSASWRGRGQMASASGLRAAHPNQQKSSTHPAAKRKLASELAGMSPCRSQMKDSGTSTLVLSTLANSNVSLTAVPSPAVNHQMEPKDLLALACACAGGLMRSLSMLTDNQSAPAKGGGLATQQKRASRIDLCLLAALLASEPSILCCHDCRLGPRRDRSPGRARAPLSSP